MLSQSPFVELLRVGVVVGGRAVALVEPGPFLRHLARPLQIAALIGRLGATRHPFQKQMKHEVNQGFYL